MTHVERWVEVGLQRGGEAVVLVKHHSRDAGLAK